MKNATDCTKKLAALLKRLPAGQPPEFAEADDPTAVLVLSFLMWECSTSKALDAFERVRAATVDLNDLRVSMPDEIAEILGPRYPLVDERTHRLRATLRGVYLREHTVDLKKLNGAGKRDVKKYIESLEGIVPYVASRVQLLSFGAHAIPVDAQLRTRLIAGGAADETMDAAELGNWLARQIKANKAVASHYALQAWAEKRGRAASGKSTPRKKTTSRPRTRRTSSRAGSSS